MKRNECAGVEWSKTVPLCVGGSGNFYYTTALCVGERHGLRNGTAWISAAE